MRSRTVLSAMSGILSGSVRCLQIAIRDQSVESSERGMIILWPKSHAGLSTEPRM
jgi:hypothetical protein